MDSSFDQENGEFYEPLWDQSMEIERSESYREQTLQSGRVDFCDAMLEKLIEFVRLQPALYDTSRTDYRDKIKKANIWESIAKSLAWEEKGDSTALLQAVVFVEDAVKYRSINHKIDPVSLWYYRLYYSRPVQWMVYAAITVIHLLAFLEHPSSLTWSSDPYYRGKVPEVPCWLIVILEAICLTIFTIDVSMKIYLIGGTQFRKSRWIMAYVIIVIYSIADWFVTVCTGCDYVFRFRRILRPFFLLQNSSIIKKTARCIMNTLPKVGSVLCLVMLHIFIFSVFGMLLFPKQPMERRYGNLTPPTELPPRCSDMDSSGYCEDSAKPNEYKEGLEYFNNITTSFISLLVLLTTANNPDVMMPAYQVNRLYSLYFISFLSIGLYFFFNMLTAVIYNEFRGFFFNSMQGSYFRRRLGFQAAFEMLRRQGRGQVNLPVSATVGAGVVKSVILQSKIKRSARKAIIAELDAMMGSSLSAADFQQLFDVLDRETVHAKPPIRTINHPRLKVLQQVIISKWFKYLGTLVATVNVIIISVEIAIQDEDSFNDVRFIGINIGCIVFYTFEQIAKIWALGRRRYAASRMNLFDGLLTVVLLCFMILTLVIYSANKNGSTLFITATENGDVVVFLPVYDLTRIVNMLIIFRIMRLITMFETMSVVAGTLVDLVRNLKALIGSLVVIYYVFAILGMEIFKNKIEPTSPVKSDNYTCGSYEQLDYWANNFDDFASSLVVLWDVMVVNNWHIFLDAYSRYTKGWAKMFFITWYFTSVLVFMNVFTALILENFIIKWDRRLRDRNREDPDSTPAPLVSLHTMFRNELHEPTEEELLHEIYNHPHIEHLVALGR